MILRVVTGARTFFMLGALLSLTIFYSLANAGGGKPAPLSDRERDGLRGPVKGVQIRIATIAIVAGVETEGTMTLSGEYLYDSLGRSIDWRTYQAGVPQTHFLIVRDSLRHTGVTFAYDGRDLQIYRTEREYSPDGLLLRERFIAREARTPWKVVEHSYDSSGRELVVTEHVTGGEESRTVNRYDGSGTLRSIASFTGPTPGKLQWEERYGNENYVMTKESMGEMRISQRVQEYNSSGKVIGHTDLYSDTSRTVRLMEKYVSTSAAPILHKEYDAAGRLLSSVIYVADSAIYRRQVITYDYRGTPVMYVTSIHKAYPGAPPTGSAPTGDIVMIDCDYDSHGNWTRQVWKRKGENSDNTNFEPYRVVQREITYYPG